jgi:hypothetical protein
MKPSLLVVALCMVCCHGKQSNNVVPAASSTPYPMIDYVQVGLMLQDIGGPTVLDLKNNEGKQVVRIGCPHSRDTTSKEFDLIDIYFKHLKPQVAFNEGGHVPEDIHYTTRNEAIRDRGETGLLKYHCDIAGIKMLNGDFTEEEEFKTMLKLYPKDELLLYYTFERFIIPYKYGMDSDKPLEVAYTAFINDYLTKHGFPLTDSEKTFDYLRQVYQHHTGQVFELDKVDIEQFDFLNDNCKFCALGRTSKVVRDEALLKKISEALDQYDRIFVTFGGAHALAIEPALKKLLREKTSHQAL